MDIIINYCLMVTYWLLLLICTVLREFKAQSSTLLDATYYGANSLICGISGD